MSKLDELLAQSEAMLEAGKVSEFPLFSREQIEYHYKQLSQAAYYEGRLWSFRVTGLYLEPAVFDYVSSAETVDEAVREAVRYHDKAKARWFEIHKPVHGARAAILRIEVPVWPSIAKFLDVLGPIRTMENPHFQPRLESVLFPS